VVVNKLLCINLLKIAMVAVVVGLRTAGQTLNTLTSSLERLCDKEERTWKDRIFNQMRLVSSSFLLIKVKKTSFSFLVIYIVL
jgi:hypothetical protein